MIKVNVSHCSNCVVLVSLHAMNFIERLTLLATATMREKGLDPEFSREANEQLNLINSPYPHTKEQDLRPLLWCSIDNDDSKDLDQLTFAEKKPNGDTTLYIAIADVDALVKKGTPIDNHAATNTTSVYTPTKIFPMLPEKLSTNLTSLNENEERVSLVVTIEMSPEGDLKKSSIDLSVVKNFAKLTYNEVGDWLEGKKGIPDKVKKIQGLEETLRLQNDAAQTLRRRRHEAGSLTLKSSEAEIRIVEKEDVIIELPPHNLAHQLIEEFMIAANRSTVQHFKDLKIASLRRIVRIPKYWNQIVDIAKSFGEILPEAPNSKALNAFLIKRQKIDPESFPDLSLTIIKLLGRGEYVVETADESAIGHFALAISDYTHSTAPNRRFPDLISQRQYKSFLKKEPLPYTLEELKALATQCTKQEDAAMKVERQLNKSAAAAVLTSQIGKTFKGIITGTGEKGTWVRLFSPAVEGKIVKSFQKVRVGDRVTVQLIYVNIAKGFIDFALKG